MSGTKGEREGERDRERDRKREEKKKERKRERERVTMVEITVYSFITMYNIKFTAVNF